MLHAVSCVVSCAVLQENELLQKQNELLRSSEAAYQQEAQLVGAIHRTLLRSYSA